MTFDGTHEVFADQPPPEASVWRYMDLARFLSILENRQLNFARADIMSDKWEGAYGEVNVAKRQELYSADQAYLAEQLPRVYRFARTTTFLNCWHMSEVESAAMWELYQREGRGVAIRSSWADLTLSITDPRRVFGAKVKCVDYKTYFVPEGNVLGPFLFKRQSFEHEREVRLITNNMGEPDASIDPDNPAGPVSLGVEIDVSRLINAVYVAPEAPSWVAELMQKVIAKYDPSMILVQSDLARDAIF